MLQEIGLRSFSDLLSSVVPEHLELKRTLELPRAIPESDLIRHMNDLASKNMHAGDSSLFLGAGAYHHFIPSAVWHVLSRSEFYTAYTPYQPEISQGTLQAIYEFQTFICQLTGMEVANASMYDGASALAEAILMALRITKKKEVYISEAVHPEYRQTVLTYCQFLNAEIKEIPIDKEGRTDLKSLKKVLSSDTAAVAIQNPNFFGAIEDLEGIQNILRENGTLFIGVVSEPVSLGLLKPPGHYGADIVVGEAQAFGNPMNFGGPGAGFFAAKNKYVRNMPGRLVGETVDTDGKRGYVLTLSTREQHIRRERATSNICTNNSLCAVAATIHLSLLGRDGLKKLALLNLKKTAYARETFSKINGCRIPFEVPIFNEFVLELTCNVDKANRELAKHKIVGGLNLETFYPQFKNHMLVCVTEMNKKEEIDAFAEKLGKIIL